MSTDRWLSQTWHVQSDGMQVRLYKERAMKAQLLLLESQAGVASLNNPARICFKADILTGGAGTYLSSHSLPIHRAVGLILNNFDRRIKGILLCCIVPTLGSSTGS